MPWLYILALKNQAVVCDFFVSVFAGGLTAVIWTDFIQTIIMVCGAIALMVLGKCM